MHYDDGADTQPGEDLSLNGQEIGQATYDMDHDGVADSYIAVTGDNEVTVLTDTNHDGTVDTAYQIEGDGSVTELHEQDGQFTAVATGHLDDQGRIEMDGGPATGPGDGGPVTTGTGPGDITLQEGGQSIDVGKPTVDLTGDGVNDTVVLKAGDGSTVLVSDADQNGQADNIAQINPDGTVTFAVSDGHGGWVVAGHGHIDANGDIAQDQGGQTGQPYQPPADLAGTPAQDPAGPSGPGGTADPADPGTDAASGPATPASGGGEDITVDVNGKTYDLGAATVDADGNGTPDTAVVHGDDGTTLLVTDTDGNGTGDQIMQVNPDGSVVIQQADGHGGWTTVGTGHLDPNGNLVIDQQAGQPAGTGR